MSLLDELREALRRRLRLDRAKHNPLSVQWSGLYIERVIDEEFAAFAEKHSHLRDAAAPVIKCVCPVICPQCGQEWAPCAETGDGTKRKFLYGANPAEDGPLDYEDERLCPECSPPVKEET